MVLDEIHENFFQDAKKWPKSDSVLTNYNENKLLIAVCGAFPYGDVSCEYAVTCHVNPYGTKQLISYGIRNLSNQERIYVQIDRGAMAIIFRLRKCQQFLNERKFLIIMDGIISFKKTPGHIP